MNVQPTKLELASPEQLRITWSDGQVREYRVRELRDKCPCATCREKRSAAPPSQLDLPILSAAEAQPLRITSMTPVGNYAYSIDFSDGHNTGIYTLESLRELGAIRKQLSDETLLERLAANNELLWWLFAASIGLLLLTPLVVAWVVARLPNDYFIQPRRGPAGWLRTRPVMRLAFLVGKNLVGIVSLLAGVLMLVLPGQGLLTIAVALMLIDFPGKNRLERWLISWRPVWRSINWLRKRAGRAPLIPPN